MTLNIDIDKLQRQIQTQGVQTNTDIAGKSSAPVEIPMNNKTNNNSSDICVQLGISQDEYFKLCTSNPEFANLTIEKQLKYIQELKKNNSASENIISENSVTSTEETASNSTNSNNEITKKEFAKLGLNKQFEIYSTELAKNKFLYGGESDKTIEDWNKLSTEEQNKLIQEQRNILETKSGKLNRRNAKQWLNTSMTELLTASTLKMTFEEFQKAPEGYKTASIYDYLFGQDPEDLSYADKIQLRETELLCNAATMAANSEFKLCPDEAIEYFENNKISPVKAQYEYLQNKIENGEEVSKFEKQRFKCLNEIMTSAVAIEAQENFGKRAGETPLLLQEIANSSYGENFETANLKNKSFIIKDYIEKTYDKKDPKYSKIVEGLMNDAIECGNYEIAFAIHEMAIDDKKLAKELSNSENKNTQITNALNTKNLGESGVNFVKKITDNKDKNLILAAQNSAGQDQIVDISAITANSEFQEVANNTVKMGHRLDDVEAAKQVAQNVKNSGNQKAINLGAATANKNIDDAQFDVLKIYTQDNEEAVHAAIDADNIGEYATENQKATLDLLLKRNEEYTQDEEVAKQYSNQLADQVEDLHASVQAEAHKIVSQSKFEEVVQHAAENIYKYDKSAQKEALKYTLETGNEKAIENAISNIDRCEGLKNETSAAPSNNNGGYDAQLEKTIKVYTSQIEGKYTQQVAEQYSNYSVEQDLRSGIITQDDAKSQKEKYIEKFKDPTVNKFALLGQLEPSLRKEALKALVKFAPTMINSFIDLGYGPEIIRIIGENSNLAVKIVNLMDFKGQSEVKSIVQRHPDNFEELYAKYFLDDDKPSLAVNEYNTAPLGGNSLLQRQDKNGQLFFKV